MTAVQGAWRCPQVGLPQPCSASFRVSSLLLHYSGGNEAGGQLFPLVQPAGPPGRAALYPALRSSDPGSKPALRVSGQKAGLGAAPTSEA